MSAERKDRIRALLEQAFQPTLLEIADDSGKHAGHSHGGGGHFSVTLCSDKFEGVSAVKRHQMVYAAVGEMMPGIFMPWRLRRRRRRSGRAEEPACLRASRLRLLVPKL